MPDQDLQVIFEGFNEGNSPLAHLDDKTFVGNRGQASDMKADIISKPGFLTQSPALVNLTNGSQAGVVDQLIRFVLDQPPTTDVTYGLGTTKLFEITPTTVTDDVTWPQAVTNMTSGESLVRLKAYVYGFFNKASGGDILRLTIADDTLDPIWGSTADQVLINAPHPVAAKEDVMVFGNGQYVGVFIEGAATLDTQKLDFGAGNEVADVVFHANVWWIAVNSTEGKRSQIYMYDGSALSSTLSDETGVGDQKIGFLYVKDGLIFVCYEDISSTGFTIGFLNGRQIKPLRYFKGTLPDHRQKSLYKNTILFLSSTEVWSFGAPVEQLSLQISKLADGGLATLGGIATPFGTPMIASTDGVSNHQLAKFSGFSVDSSWQSVLADIASGRLLGKIDTVIVDSKKLGADAKCNIYLEGSQGEVISPVLVYTGTDKLREVFRTVKFKPSPDLRVRVEFADGDTTNDCPIRKITCLGTFQET